MNIERSSIVETHATVAGIACLAIGLKVFAIDGFGQNAGTGGFSHAPRTAKQESMSQGTLPDCIFERGGNMLLPDYRTKILWTVLEGGYNKLFHAPQM